MTDKDGIHFAAWRKRDVRHTHHWCIDASDHASGMETSESIRCEAHEQGVGLNAGGVDVRRKEKKGLKML
jgi:hypothetical protein